MDTIYTLHNSELRHLSALDNARLDSGDLITSIHHESGRCEVQAVFDCAPAVLMGLITNYEDMPDHIFGLEQVDLLERYRDVLTLRFTMKLPFPIGKIVWSNVIKTTSTGSGHSLEWTLVEGDLKRNEGSLILLNHRGNPNRTYARYSVSVQSAMNFPKKVELMMTRWLVPRVVEKLRRVAEAANR